MYGSWRSSSQTIEIVHGDKASSMDPVTCDPGSRTGHRTCAALSVTGCISICKLGY